MELAGLISKQGRKVKVQPTEYLNVTMSIGLGVTFSVTVAWFLKLGENFPKGLNWSNVQCLL